MDEFLSGFVNKKLSNLICRKNNIALNTTIEMVGKDKVIKCINQLREFYVTVTESNSFENAQVCSGGVPLSEVSNSFESLITPNVYIVGELLDCDAMCGGYNLQWAWSSAFCASDAILGALL